MLTDNCTHFYETWNTGSAAPDIRAAVDAGELFWAHAFEYAYTENDLNHRLTKPKHPWTNGQVERMNRTIKHATVKRLLQRHDQLRAHLADFVTAYNFARRLKKGYVLVLENLFFCREYRRLARRWMGLPKQAKMG